MIHLCAEVKTQNLCSQGLPSCFRKVTNVNGKLNFKQQNLVYAEIATCGHIYITRLYNEPSNVAIKEFATKHESFSRKSCPSVTISASPCQVIECMIFVLQHWVRKDDGHHICVWFFLCLSY